ncbi:hypothetical protein [Streptomyces sp. NBC_01594]|uniref:hypothetical protein n=1 Tax=Streptomyces sp. NBC_01594 TaxID=2975890 RepID=UPI00386592B0
MTGRLRRLRRRVSRTLASLLATAVLVPLAACSATDGPAPPGKKDDGAPRAGTLRVLASSELADMKTLLEQQCR